MKRLFLFLSMALFFCTTNLMAEEFINKTLMYNDWQKNDLIEYLNQLELFENKLLSFKSENSRAIYERITRISEYSETAYKARNINGEV